MEGKGERSWVTWENYSLLLPFYSPFFLSDSGAMESLIEKYLGEYLELFLDNFDLKRDLNVRISKADATISRIGQDQPSSPKDFPPPQVDCSISASWDSTGHSSLSRS